MERKLYLQLCREVAAIPGGIENIKNVPTRLRVRFDGMEYYPVKYELGFLPDGSTTHTAVLHELGANAVFCVELGKVEWNEMG